MELKDYLALSYEELSKGRSFLQQAKADKNGDVVRTCIQHVGTQACKSLSHVLLELCTGFGKTKCALDVIESGTWLIVHRMLTHKTNIQLEIAKWQKLIPGYLNGVKIVYTTYAGIKKFKGCHFDGVICDEAHNLTENSLNILASIQRKSTILLTASLPTEKRRMIEQYFQIDVLRVTLREAQQWGVLPTIKFFVVPIYDTMQTPAEILRRLELESELKRAQSLQKKLIAEKKPHKWVLDTRILPIGAKRKLLLSEIKVRILFQGALQEFLQQRRTIVFLDTIKQAERLPFPTVHSKMKKQEVLNQVAAFNSGQLVNISAVNMLNESMNLFDLQIGLMFSLGRTNEVTNIQRTGRMTRATQPIIILPYLVGTSDEKLVLTFVKQMIDAQVVGLDTLVETISSYESQLPIESSN